MSNHYHSSYLPSHSYSRPTLFWPMSPAERAGQASQSNYDVYRRRHSLKKSEANQSAAQAPKSE